MRQFLLCATYYLFCRALLDITCSRDSFFLHGFRFSVAEAIPRSLRGGPEAPFLLDVSEFFRFCPFPSVTRLLRGSECPIISAQVSNGAIFIIILHISNHNRFYCW